MSNKPLGGIGGGGTSSTSANVPSASSTADKDRDRSFFESQREILLQDVGANMESVLQNINKLNRSLEGIIAVGNEFSSVEALWSYFENIMAKSPEENTGAEGEGDNAQDTTEIDGQTHSGRETQRR